MKASLYIVPFKAGPIMSVPVGWWGSIGLFDIVTNWLKLPITPDNANEWLFKKFVENKPYVVDWGLHDDAMILQRYTGRSVKQAIEDYKKEDGNDGFTRVVSGAAETISNFFGWLTFLRD